MTHILFLFLDGIGLGRDDPKINPFAHARMPALIDLLGGRRLIADSVPHNDIRSSLLALDACMGVEGLPQSATGQATLMSGENIPAAIGYHYGPKPNTPVANYLQNGNIFSRLQAKGVHSALLNAYPTRYFEAIESGRRIYSAIPLAVTSAGLQLKTENDLNAGLALAADFTAQGWHDHLGLTDTPVLAAHEAGEKLTQLASYHHFSMFEYWLSDYAGHRQDMDQAVHLLEEFDQVLAGLLSSWDDQSNLLLITSDHGNLEDLSTRRHTLNPVPAILVGPSNLRSQFSVNLRTIASIAPAILELLSHENEKNCSRNR